MAANESERLDRQALAAERDLANVPNPYDVTKTQGSRFGFDLAAIDAHLAEEIIGQHEARALICETLELALADIGDPRRPLATCLFLGPTGVGKTEIVRALARALHGDADALCRVDMNTLSQEHYAASLTGAPPGYVGSKEGSTVFDQDLLEGRAGRPGLVLFDELEKASPEVILALLNIFDNGLMTVASGGKTYSFRKAIIFMTSNLGTKAIYGAQTATLKERIGRLVSGQSYRTAGEIAENELLNRFPPEFVNRIDRVQIFNPLRVTQAHELIGAEIRRINKRLERRGVQLILSEPAIEQLREKGFDQKFGARDLKRELRKAIEIPLARHIVACEGKFSPAGQTVWLRAVPLNGVMSFDTIKDRPYRSANDD
ncbi:probable chaperone [Fulvimarina pelagi HTCC2506]|uniref:Probable chaperone n=2 Tax=Fulvimarina pelagi TaxID=217511 RepID=Q0FY89_9HYPH|nr:AAA family ATPase [Fulvimarina pelagi]EAU39853.1 probable chaperone [Fulvimarina pelagi HTCC2506]